MISPIYFFTKSGCAWSAKMLPIIEKINITLSDEQKIEIHNIEENKSTVIYDDVIRITKVERTTPMMYNSSIGSVLLGFHDENQIRKFLRAESVPETKPLTPMPQFMVTTSSKKDFDNWRKDVILWYEINKNQLPPNVVDKEKVIDMVYNQFMAHRTKPLTIEERLTKLEEHSHEPQNYREECEKMNKQIKILKKQIKILKKKLGK